MASIADIFARIGLKADTAQGKTFLDQLKHITIGLGIATISATAFIGIIKSIANESINTALSLKKFHQETGASTDQLQRWQAVADETNNSGQAVAESIQAIVDNQQKIKLGQGNIGGYQLLGINPNQDPFKIMEDLRTKTVGLSQAMKKNVMSQIGVSKDLIAVLDLTNEQFDDMSRNAFIIPSSTINMIDRARASMKQVDGAIKYLKAEITSALTPSIIKVNKAILEWIRNNKDGLIKTIKSIFDIIVKISGAIVNTTSMINRIIKETIGFKDALYLVILAITILNRALIFSPIGLITMGVIALIAVLDDLYVYSQGGDSLFGELANKFPVIKDFVDSLIGLSKAFDDIRNGDWSNFDILTRKLGILGTIIQTMSDALSIFKATLDSLGAIGSLFSGDKVKIEKGFSKSSGSIMNIMDRFAEKLGFDPEKIFGAFAPSNRTETKNNIKIDVHAENKTANEIAGRTAEEVRKAIGMQHAYSNLKAPDMP
jgi:hypothetical protein